MGLLSTIGAASARSFGLTRLSAAIKDAYFNLTTLLLPGNGTNGAQNNTFLDSSSNNFTITRNGNTTQGTFSPFSQTGWSNYFNGSNATLQTTALNISTGNFTVEAWVNLNAMPTSDSWPASYQNWIVVVGVGTASLADGWQLRLGTTQIAFGTNSDTTAVTGAHGISIGNWYHIAAVRSGNVYTLYVNGVQVASATYTANAPGTGAFTWIGSETGQSSYVNGYISNVRVTSGALYSGTFTPSTTPLSTTVSAGTALLLTCQDNRFKDNSSNGYTFTINGAPSVQAFSPFAPTAAYSAATNGGSGYFDGSGDWIQAAAATGLTFGTGAFTVEAWLYPTSGSGTERDFISNISSTGDADTVFSARISSSNTIITSTYLNNLVVGSITVPLNTWTHYLFSFDGTTYRQFINGAADGTSTTVRNISNSTNPWTIGRTNWTARYFTGNIAGVRLVKGSAVQTSAFTPPTAPPTAITNTQLLLNFTNGGIFDQTGKNVLETVGNAQISTSVKKWGTGSLAFDGTGDGLLLPASPFYDFKDQNFTVEGWVYIAGNSVLDGSSRRYANIFSVSSSSGFVFNFVIKGDSTTTGTGLEIYNGTNIVGVTGTVSQNAWNHLAVSKSGSSVYFFLNGTQMGTTQTTSGNWGSSTVTAQVGRALPTNYTFDLNGYIDDLRITRYARYTANFTPPTAAFADQ